MSPVKYEQFFIPEDDVLHSHRRENLKSYISQLWLAKKGMILCLSLSNKGTTSGDKKYYVLLLAHDFDER
jgi:hypothetical protein